MRKEAQVGFQAGAAFGAPLTARGPPRGAVQVLFLPVPSLPLLGARDLCRAELASFGLVLRPGGLPLRQGPRRFGPREGLRRSPGRTPAPRALESGAWVSCGLRRASPGDFTAWPRCVCVCVCGRAGRPAHCAGGNQSRHPRRGRRAGPTGPAEDRGGESEPGGARARPLASLVSREEAAQTAGSPTRGEGRGRRRHHSGGSRRVCGLWCPGRTWSQHRVQLGLPGAPQRVPLKKARCFCKWVWGSDAWAFRLPLGVLRSELRLSGEA